MLLRTMRYAVVALFFVVIGAAVQPAWATLPTPNQPVLVVQDSTSSDPYQNFIPELLTTEGLNGFQTAQLTDLTATFLANYDVVILPHLTLTAAQATLLQNYVNAGGTLVGFRPDLQLANVFGVAPLGTTLSEGWLKIDTTTAYGAGLDAAVMKFHGVADLYTLGGATSLATLYNNATTATASPAAAVYAFGTGKAVLFSFDLTQSNVLMRQGNPAWAGYPNNHDGNNTMRASQMFMDQGTGQYWNDLGDGALNDVPQADIQLRLFSNAVTLTNAAKRPLPRLWYFPNQNRNMLLMTADEHSYNSDLTDVINEVNSIQAAGGKDTIFLWYPYGLITPDQVNAWLFAGHSVGVHFDDTAEADASGVGGSAASWNGMQAVITNAVSSFAATYPTAPAPLTTRDHFLIWVSNNADGNPDQTAQAKLFQASGIQLDTSYSSFPNRWGYMSGTGLPMKFLDTATGTIIPVYEQPTQYEDDVQLDSSSYSLNWDVSTAKGHYQKSLSDSSAKYNTVVTMLFHPDHWSDYLAYSQAVLQYAQTNSIPMYSAASWLQFWQARAATALSLPTYVSNTLAFTATGAPDGLTVTVPYLSGGNFASTFTVDGVAQNFAVVTNEGVAYAAVTLAAGTHNLAVTYAAGARIIGTITPGSAATGATVAVQGVVNQTLPVASDGTFVVGLSGPGTYTLTPSSPGYYFSPWSRSVTLNGVDVTGVNFAAQSSFTGQTLFTTETPVVPDANDGTDYELGTVLQSDVPGYITGLRFWKAPGETGAHTGTVWSSTGTPLVSVTFTNETGSGWQQQALPAPLSISANTPYIVSVNTAAGSYVATVGGLSSQVVNQDLSSIVGSNGLFGSPGTFPTGTFNGTNYFRDVFFTPSSGLMSVSLNPATVMGGSASIGTVLLSGPAPTGGATVSLSGDTGLVSMPASVTVPTGALGATFAVTTQPVASSSTAAVTATYDVTRSTTLTIAAPSVLSVTLDSTTVTGGSSTTATVTLNSAAPVGGIAVTLSSNNASATVPPSVIVAAGATTATFAVNTTAVASTTTAAISATLGVTQAASLTINPPAVSSLDLNPFTVTGGLGSIGTVTLNDPAPAGGAIVALLSDNAAVTVPASVTIAAGGTTATFSIATVSVPAPINANISATYGSTATAVLTVTPPGVTSVAFNATHLVAGTSSTGSVTISGPAPAGGSVIALTSDLPTVSEIEGVYLPSDLPIGGSVDWASFGPEYTTINSGTVIPVTGIPGLNMTLSNAGAGAMESLSNCDFGGDCAWYGNFARGARVLWVSGTYYSETGWWAGNGPLTLQFDSPQRGIGFQAMGDEGGPFTATVCAYNSSNILLGCVPFTGNGTSVADGSAAFMGVYDDVQEISKIVIDAGGALYPHDFGISQLFITGARRTFIPSTVVVPAGTTTAGFPINATTVAIPTTVNITASLNGTRVNSLTLDPAALASITPAPSTVVGGVPLTATVTLTGRASAGGAVVTLSSDNPVSTGVQFVNSATAIPRDNTVTWTDLGPSFTSIPSNTAVPIPGAANSTVTISNGASDALYVLTNCPAVADCGFSGNFVPADPLLWVDGSYDETGTVWTGHGPLTLRFSNPQHGVGFNIMADEGGPFSATVCAYNSDDALLGCKAYNGNGAALAGGTNGMAVFTGIYDDKLEIAKITIDGGGALYPHDFAIGPLSLATTRRMVPQTVTVQAGASTATFPVNTDTVNQVTTVSISGNYLGAQTGTLIVLPPAITSFTLNPSTVVGGTSSTATLTFGTPVPAGTVVTLSSDKVAAVVPASISVPEGATSVTFTVTTSSVGAGTSAKLTASYSLSSLSATLTINPPGVTSVSFSPNVVLGGGASTGTVTLNAPAPAGGAAISLSSDSSAAVVPATVTVAAGDLTATFAVSTNPVGSVTTATISATYNSTQSAPLTINAPAIASVALNPASLTGGGSSTGTVTLNGPAAASGAIVSLSSSNVAATVPASITIAAGASSGTFTVNATAVVSVTTVTITGTYNGTQTTSLTINSPVLSAVALSPATVTGGSTSTGSVTLDGPAPVGGAAVLLSSDNGSATVATSVTVAAGATTATFTVNTGAVATPTTATISGNYNGSQTASLGINPPALASVSVNPATLSGGNTSTGSVTLTGPAPTVGTVVTLSSDNSAATVPATVTVTAGATAATFTINTNIVASALTANIGGAYNGNQSSAALTINPPVLASVAVNPDNVTGGTGSTGTVTLNTPAPAGGALVTLSSNNGAATLPGSVTIAEGSSTASFTVNTTAVAAATPVTISGAYNGTQTVSLTINPPVLASVALNPTSLVGGNSSTGTVTLNGPAPAGGSVVTLASNSGSATVSSSVTVAAGNTAANFTVNTLPGGTVTTVTISGTYGGTQSASLTINPPTVSSVALNPSTVAGGASSTGTVTLSSPAPVGGAGVSLSSDNGSATVPSSVTVAANATTATFTVTTSAVASITTANISASFNGTQSAALTINPPVLLSVSVNPTSVTGGGSSTGTVTLASPAPAGAAVVTLSSDNGSATVPASVTVAAGATSATFTVTTTTVATSTVATISGTLGTTQNASFTINPPTVSSVTVNPTSVVGGNSSIGTVTLNGAAPSGGLTLTLSSNNGAATVPATVTVTAGATTANFTVNTTGVASTTTATITAGGTQTAILTINPAALSSAALNPTSLTGATSSTGTVTLSGLAPAGGTVVTLSSNSGSATVPVSVTVTAGASTANFTVNTTAVASTTTATITASLNGVNKTAALTINAPALSAVSMNPASVTGGTSSTGTVTLSGPAPSGGIVVALSDNSAAATTPVSVTVAAGATSANFTETTTGVAAATTVTITATLNGTATNTLTVNPPSLTSVAVNPTTVNGGTNSTGTVTLSGPAATGGAVVSLSSNNAAATTPSSVTVLAGATTANFTVTTITVGSTTVDTITATYNGSHTTTLTINPPPVTGVTLLPTSVVGGNTSTGTVTILNNAPTGGLVVNLSSNNAAATVPASVTVASGSKTANFTVTTSAVSSAATATITATGNGTATANLTINPAALSSVSMSPATVTGGTSSTGTVNLTGLAPVGGIVVSLSDNNANATTPASVTVPAGSSSATFTVTTVGVTANTTVTITAVYNGVTKTATLTINSPGIASVALNPTTITGSQSSTGTVTLNSPATGSGTVVSLSASGGSASTPATVTVPTGATTANFTVSTTSVGANTSSTITATLNGLATATLTINAPQVLSITLNPTTVKGGSANSIATVTLNAPAAGNTPQRGVSLSSSNTAAATVPSSITFAAGQTSMQFTVTSKVVATQATSTISATMNGGPQTSVLTVTP